MFKRLLSLFVIVCFFSTSLSLIPGAHADSPLGLPAPGTMINLSPAYEPVIIKGLTVHKDNPFLFDFIVDVGQDNMSGAQLKKEGEKLIKYFLASLAIPDKDLWVNLSPYEKNRMIPNALGQTDMGRDLLEQDYILKQITASLIYPEKQLGKEFWDRVYAKARQMYGTTQIPVNTFNKVWIMADRAEVFEHNQTAFVVDSHLKVMLEEDYLALQKHSPTRGHVPVSEANRYVSPSTKAPQGNHHSPNDNSNDIANQIIRQIILPELEHEVNYGQNFANLRQIFNSVILSSWYKNNLKQALLNQVYANKSQINGVKRPNSIDSAKVASLRGVDTTKQSLQDLSPDQIYEQYLKAYKKGVFNYIKEATGTDGRMIPRKYFSGGMKIAPDHIDIIDGAMGAVALEDSLRSGRAMVDFNAGMITTPQRPTAQASNPNAAMMSDKIEEMTYTRYSTARRAALNNEDLNVGVDGGDTAFTYNYVTLKKIPQKIPSKKGQASQPARAEFDYWANGYEPFVLGADTFKAFLNSQFYGAKIRDLDKLVTIQSNRINISISDVKRIEGNDHVLLIKLSDGQVLNFDMRQLNDFVVNLYRASKFNDTIFSPERARAIIKDLIGKVTAGLSKMKKDFIKVWPGVPLENVRFIGGESFSSQSLQIFISNLFIEYIKHAGGKFVTPAGNDITPKFVLYLKVHDKTVRLEIEGQKFLGWLKQREQMFNFAMTAQLLPINEEPKMTELNPIGNEIVINNTWPRREGSFDHSLQLYKRQIDNRLILRWVYRVSYTSFTKEIPYYWILQGPESQIETIWQRYKASPQTLRSLINANLRPVHFMIGVNHGGRIKAFIENKLFKDPERKKGDGLIEESRPGPTIPVDASVIDDELDRNGEFDGVVKVSSGLQRRMIMKVVINQGSPTEPNKQSRIYYVGISVNLNSINVRKTSERKIWAYIREGRPEAPGFSGSDQVKTVVLADNISGNNGLMQKIVDKMADKLQDTRNYNWFTAGFESDPAALAKPKTWHQGGIDLNTSHGMNWKVSTDGQGVEMDLDPAMLAQMKANGLNYLSEVIYKMTPVKSVWPMLGLAAPHPVA